MNPLRHPTRRRFLKAIGIAIVAAPLARAGRNFLRRPKLVRPEDLPATGWIGHC